MTRLAILMAMLTGPAIAHEWYDPWCCNAKDCAPVPASSVQSAPGGYLLTLDPGAHPLVLTRIEAFVSYDDATRFKRSQDDRWHVCIYPRGVVRCVYQPEGDF